jgi:hypothetical protein
MYKRGLSYDVMLSLTGNAIEKISEESNPPSRKHSNQVLSNGTANKSINELLYNSDSNKTVAGEKASKNNVKVASSSKRLNEDHNLNELENKNEQDGRVANGHAGRSLAAGKRSVTSRTHGDCEEDSDSGESSNTSTSSCPSGGKKENLNKASQVCPGD